MDLMSVNLQLDGCCVDSGRIFHFQRMVVCCSCFLLCWAVGTYYMDQLAVGRIVVVTSVFVGNAIWIQFGYYEDVSCRADGTS